MIKDSAENNLEKYPLVSIITSVLNGEKFLEDSILSVLNQTYGNIEYIIIDGDSTDGTLAIIKKYHTDIYYWVSEPDKGIYNAWNKGLKVANGEWIGFLGSDDCYLPDAILNYMEAIKKNNVKIDYISSIIDLVRSDMTFIRKIGNPWTWEKFSKHMCVAHVGSLHNKSYFDEFGFYNENYAIVSDYEMLLRKKNKLKTMFVKKTTAQMRTGGVSNNFINKSLYETLKVKLNLNVRNKYLCKIDYVWAHFKISLREYSYEILFIKE